MNIATNNATGAVILNAVSAPDATWTLREVDAVPAPPVPRNGARLLWQNNALAWVVPTPTPQQTFAAAVAAGYTVPGVAPALVLDLSDAAQGRFTSLLVYITAALAASPARLATTDAFPITDISGNPRVFSVADVQTMILGYAEYYAGLFATLHAPAVTPTPAS